MSAWGDETLNEVARQARLRCRLLHPNINAFLGYTEFPSLCLVSSWAPNGSLESVLSRAVGGHLLPASFGRRLARDVAAGLAYLHSLRPALIHRALSTRKVLLDGQLRAVISDFTLAASVVEVGPDFKREQRVVDPPRLTVPPAPWAAPEVRQGRAYGLSCDLYSWAVVARQIADKCERDTRPVVEEGLLARCLLVEAGARPTSDEVLSVCEAAVAVAVQLPDESVFGVGLKESLPGDSTSEGWQIAPKFKLAHEYLEYGDFVAEGGFSEIYRGTYKGRAVAIKKLKTWLLGDETLLEFQKEAEVLASLYHPNILVMVGITTFPSLSIVTPWAERGSLDRYIYKQDNALPAALACRIQLGIARGALYLHSVRILHRDIKAANVLLGKYFNPRLADFGLSVRKQVPKQARSSKPGSDELNVSLDAAPVAPVVHASPPRTPQHLSASRFVSSPFLPSAASSTDPHHNRPARHASRLAALLGDREEGGGGGTTVAESHPLGTWPWQAPEVMQCQPHSEACDVYALGVTMWELWARKPPFALLSAEDYEARSASNAVYRPPMSAIAHSPQDVQLLVARCWLSDPASRPQMSQVVQTLSAVVAALD